MLAEQTRSGLAEAYHDGAFAAVGSDLKLLAWSGDIDHLFYLRSSAKPFQAFIAQESGAELSVLELALACSSHDGLPAHVSIVESILSSAGLTQDSLKCPKSWPASDAGRDLLVAGGYRQPRRLWHNCSGKHASWLRACVASGWDTETYLAPEHPLQQRIRDFVHEVGGVDVNPVGIDGCGAPVLRTSVRAMATMYARLAVESRFDSVRRAMHAYPALVSGVGNGDAQIGMAFNGVAKRGAGGCIGASVIDQIGAAAKAWDGNDRVAAQAVASGLEMLLPLTETMENSLRQTLHPSVLGGGQQVGVLKSVLELNRA